PVEDLRAARVAGAEGVEERLGEAGRGGGRLLVDPLRRVGARGDAADVEVRLRELSREVRREESLLTDEVEHVPGVLLPRGGPGAAGPLLLRLDVGLAEPLRGGDEGAERGLLLVHRSVSSSSWSKSPRRAPRCAAA